MIATNHRLGFKPRPLCFLLAAPIFVFFLVTGNARADLSASSIANIDNWVRANQILVRRCETSNESLTARTYRRPLTSLSTLVRLVRASVATARSLSLDAEASLGSSRFEPEANRLLAHANTAKPATEPQTSSALRQPASKSPSLINLETALIGLLVQKSQSVQNRSQSQELLNQCLRLAIESSDRSERWGPGIQLFHDPSAPFAAGYASDPQGGVLIMSTPSEVMIALPRLGRRTLLDTTTYIEVPETSQSRFWSYRLQQMISKFRIQ